MNTKTIAIILGVVVILVAGLLLTKNQTATNDAESEKMDAGAMMEKESDDENMMVDGDEAMMEGDEEKMEGAMMDNYSGSVIAGKSAPYLDFNKTDYENALKSGKVVFLNFYANWCPICRAEASEMVNGFNKLTTDNLVGFRVNYNDTETDSLEKDLAEKYKITYQHTKVILQNGKEVYNKIEQWEENDVVTNLNSY